jgi:hypothetical protein
LFVGQSDGAEEKEPGTKFKNNEKEFPENKSNILLSLG